jgi:NTE family protein
MGRQTAVLALSGGGARGVAHLGAIEVLLDAGFHFERLVGVSIGSLVAAMYAFDPDIDRVRERALEFILSDKFQEGCQRHLTGTRPGNGDESAPQQLSVYGRVAGYVRANRLFHRLVTRPSLLPRMILDDVIAHLVPDADIADAVVPLSIVAVDLRSGRRVELERGPVREAVRASKSLPGIFPTVEWDDMLLADIGMFDSLPTVVARSYTDGYVIGIDVGAVSRPWSQGNSALAALMRMDEIGESMLRTHSRNAADLIITPAVARVDRFDFSQPLKLVEAGRVAARETLSRTDLFEMPAAS